MKEAAKEGWSSRTPDRNISTQYYYRLLKAPEKEPVIREMIDKTAALQNPEEIIKNPKTEFDYSYFVDQDPTKYVMKTEDSSRIGARSQPYLQQP